MPILLNRRVWGYNNIIMLAYSQTVVSYIMEVDFNFFFFFFFFLFTFLPIFLGKLSHMFYPGKKKKKIDKSPLL